MLGLLSGNADHIRTEQRIDIGFVKHIFAVAEVAINLDAALFRHHAADFFPAQHQQHIADLAPRTGT